VAAVAAGCGSSKHATTATVPVISKAAFLAQGNAICKEGNQQEHVGQAALEKVVGNGAPSPAQITTYVNETFIPLIQTQIERIRALGAPAGEAAKVTSMLNLAHTDLKRVQANPTVLASAAHPFADFAQVAHAYGLTECAKKA
jgi:hypothetical protein